MLIVRMCLRSSGREQSVQRHGQGAGWICGRPLSVLAACNLSHFLSLSMPRLGDLGARHKLSPESSKLREDADSGQKDRSSSCHLRP